MLVEAGITEEGHDRLVQRFEDSVVHPAASELIFYSDKHFDAEPTADQVVDAALGSAPSSSARQLARRAFEGEAALRFCSNRKPGAPSGRYCFSSKAGAHAARRTYAGSRRIGDGGGLRHLALAGKST